MNRQRLLTWGAALVALVVALANARTPAPVRGFDVAGFGRLPLLEGGRVKPLDSLARNSLLVLRGNQRFSFEGRTVGPDEWMLDVLFRPQVADRQPVFVIDDPEVLGLMGYRQESDRYYGFNELRPHLASIRAQADEAHAIDSKERTRFQAAIVNLSERITLYFKLKNTIQPEDAALAEVVTAVNAPQVGAFLKEMVGIAHFRVLPAAAAGGAWQNTAEALLAVRTGAPIDPALNAWAQLGAAWAAEDARSFSEALGRLRVRAEAGGVPELASSDAETVFNRVQPFYAGMIIYVLALLALFASWMGKRDLMQSLAFGLLSAGALVHTAGLVSRVVLQGRPPVTNLYSSAVFVGWGAVVLGLILERVYRRGVGTAVAATTGFASLIIAHHLASSGDTMEMMRAVLDSNFWLATHVVTITIGYSGTFLAGFLAIAYALRKHLARELEPATTKALSSMVYGVLAFSLLFSFVGTVLGGIWADQSWGRFWGWDPKENGALLIVLWNALILHARWGGYARERGIMALAIFGNVITSLSWFGVNMLGVGLHSYGFMDSAFWALAGFDAVQIALMALCLAPRRFWRGAPPTVPA